MDDADLIEFRRELHRSAETAFLEFGTSARIEQAVADLPVTVRTGRDAVHLDRVVGLPDEDAVAAAVGRAVENGADAGRVEFFARSGTGLVVTLRGSRPGPVWGLRTDIDALPLRESTAAGHAPADQGFRSPHDTMHACGHDAHAAIGVGLLHRLRDRDFGGTVKVLFQPAEEGVRGAQAMLDAGSVDDVDRMLAVHVAGDSPYGEVIGSFSGGLATRKFLVEFEGRASHAAGTPEAGRNALLAAAIAAPALMAIPRFSEADTRINVGTLHAGSGVNIVPPRARLTGEVRATDDDVVEELLRRAQRVVSGAAHSQEVSHLFAVSGSSATLRPDDALVDLLVAASRGGQDITHIERVRHLSGSDDANLLIRHVQQRGGDGAYFMAGAGSPGPHHSATFDVDERVIGLTVGVLERLLRSAAA